MNRWMFFCGSLFFLTIVVETVGQVPPLERVVNISFRNTPMTEVLSKLSQAADFTFSYNSNIPGLQEQVTASFQKKTVRQVLMQLFSDRIRFKERGNYIILVNGPGKSIQQGNSQKPFIIMGYVLDKDSGAKIKNASVYDKNTLLSAVSDPFGFFRLKIDDPHPVNTITVSKVDYQDTTFLVHQDGGDFYTVYLKRKKKIPDLVLQDSALTSINPLREIPHRDTLALAKIEIVDGPSGPAKINMQNIKDTLYRMGQVSFLPFLGSNHWLSGNVINDYSLNILGGYSFGTRKVEVASLFNVNRQDVSQAQFAGIFNMNGGKVTGGQFAGIFNMIGGGVDGGQFAGIFNYANTGYEGVQFAGVANVSGNKSVGGQFAGVVNVLIEESSGVQFAGVANMQRKSGDGIQAAGVINTNLGHFSGVQVAGVINLAHTMEGVQVGLFNFSDSIQGLPIGLLSVSRKGYHTLELSADEIFFVGMAFRTGVRPFYNIISANISPEDTGDPLWALGYGLGTTPKLAKSLYVNFDVTTSHVSKGHLKENLSLLNRFYGGVEVQLAKNIALSAGLTYNFYITDLNDINLPPLFQGGFSPKVNERLSATRDLRFQSWWGAKIAIRFF